MLTTARQVVELQVGRASRRLFAQTLIRALAIAWTLALIVAAGWMLAEPYAVQSPPAWLQWAVLAGSLLIATTVAVIFAVRRSPSKTIAAMSIDQQFGLRERVVTSFALTDEQANTSAGQALLADVQTKVAQIKIAEKFPVRLPWASAGVPLGTAAVALLALFYHPVFSTALGTTENNLPIAPEARKEITKKLDDLVKKPKSPEKLADRQKSEDLKRLEAKLEDIAKQPRDTTKQLRERIKDLTPLEEEMKKLERDRTEKAKSMQQALQQKDKMMPNEVPKDGPAKDLNKALADGDIEQAKKEVEQLAKKLANNELNEKDKKDLEKQLDDLAKKMDRLANQKDKEEQLKKLHQDGKLDAEALQRELAELKKDTEKLKDLQKLAQKLGQCQKCLKQGDAGQASKALGDAAQQLAEMDLDSQELEDIRDQLQRLKDAKESMCKGCCDGEGECQGNGMGQCQGDGKCRSDSRGHNDFASGAGQATGRRPDGQQGKINTFDAKQNSQFNPKGQKVFDGYAPGQAFKKKPGLELVGEIKQAAQEAPDAIEVQRIPKAARDMAKGYFKNLGGQQEGKPEPKKPDEKK